MPRLPSLREFLGVAGDVVTVQEQSALPVSDYLVHFQQLASWLRVEHVEDQAVPCPRMTVRGPRPHGDIVFVGALKNRMLEPLVLALRALATGVTDLDTPASPVFLQDLPQTVPLLVVVGMSCPFCPAATSVALRLATSTFSKVRVRVIRADCPGAPPVRAVPTIFDDRGVVNSGPVQEMQLVQMLLERHGVPL